MVIEEEGKLRQSRIAYDMRVTGIISGAGNCKPGILLDKKSSDTNRMPLALMHLLSNPNPKLNILDFEV